MVDDKVFMKEALKQAKKAYEKNEIPIGAVLVKDGKIISRGRNSVIEQNDMTSHAEINALRKAGKKLENYRLPGLTLYTTLEPCSMCAGAIIESRIERIVIGALDPKRGAIISNLELTKSTVSNTDIAVTTGVMEKECLEIIQEFFMELRERKKK